MSKKKEAAKRRWSVWLRESPGSVVPLSTAVEVEAAWLDTDNAALSFYDSEGCVVKAFGVGVWQSVNEVTSAPPAEQ